jgi:hypothetical protein
MLGQRRRLKAVFGRPSDLAIAGLFRLANYVDSTSSGSSSPGSSQKWIVMVEGNDVALSPDGPALSPARSPHRPTATPILSTTHLDVSLSADHTQRYHSWNNFNKSGEAPPATHAAQSLVLSVSAPLTSTPRRLDTSSPFLAVEAKAVAVLD